MGYNRLLKLCVVLQFIVYIEAALLRTSCICAKNVIIRIGHAHWLAEKKMVVSYCVVGCRNRHGEWKGLGFYRIPMIPEKRKKSWIAAIKKKNWNPVKHLRICGDHFVTGE